MEKHSSFPTDRGLYLIYYNGPSFTEGDGTVIETGCCKVGQQIRNLNGVFKRYGDHAAKYGGDPNAITTEIICRVRDRDDLDILEKMVQNTFRQRRLKNARGSTKEWMQSTDRAEIIEALHKAFNSHFSIAK